MKILFILPCLPYPLDKGGNQAMFNGIAAIKDRDEAHVIYLECYNRRNDEQRHKLENLLGNVTISPFVYNHRKGGYKFYYWLIDQIAKRFNLTKYKDYCSDVMAASYKMVPQEYVDYVNGYIKEHNIDIVQVEMIDCLPFVLALPPTVKKIFVHHEIRFVVNALALQRFGGTTYRKANMELAKIQEIGLLNKYDGIITLSETDNHKLKDAGVTSTVYTSLAVVNSSSNISKVKQNPHLLTFVGPSTHSPNYNGVMWFLNSCWKMLLAEDNDFRLRIIGNWDEKTRSFITKKYGDRIEFAGFVENLADALQGSLMIVPILVGSGIRMKILEAASMGVPFVSTTVGAEGLPFKSGRDCMLADNPEDFVHSILLMKDNEKRMEFAKNANMLVKNNYSLEALAENRLDIYKKV